MKKLIDIEYKSDYELIRGSEYSAGIDLRVTEDIVIKPKEHFKTSSKVSIDLPKGYFGLLLPRSSFGVLYPALTLNSGVIDEDYIGEMHFVIYNNLSKSLFSNNSIKIAKDTRIAQLIITPYLGNINLIKVDKLKETKRGNKGFGSSGK